MKIFNLFLILFLISGKSLAADLISYDDFFAEEEAKKEKKIDSKLDDLEDIEFIDKESDNKKKETALFKKISGSINSSYASTDNGARSNFISTLRYEEKLKDLKLVLEGAYISSKIEIEQELQNNNQNLPQSRTLTYTIDKAELQESYASYNIKNIVNLTYGRKKIVWGQFEPFSPVDFTLPIYFSRTGSSFTKLGNRVPLDHGNLTINFTPQITFDAYYIPYLRYDDVTEETVEERGRFYTEVTDNGGGGVNFNVRNKPYDVPNGSDEEQYAARLMFYPNWATFGFTYFRGWNTNFAEDFSVLKGVDYTGGSAADFYFSEPNPGLLRQEMFGFEISKKIKRTTYKFEFSKSRTIENLHNISDQTSNITGKRLEFLNKVINENGGKLYVEEDLYFGAFGVDVELDKWQINFVTYFFDAVPEDSVGEELIKLDEEAFPEDDGFDGNIFPALHVARHLNDRKTLDLGIIGGIIGPGAGVALYLKGEYKENLSWLVSLESIEYFSDEIIDSANDDGSYEKEDDTSNGIRVGLSYKF